MKMRGTWAFRLSGLALATLALLSVAAVPGATAAGDGSAVIEAEGYGRKPIVVGHRGASGYRPEHTLASYELAARMGADYIEPDLVSTKDGVLVTRHENEIGGTTDVANHQEFASRKKTKVVDGVSLTGWFTEDFTLAELKTLRAKERIPQLRPHNTLYDGRYQVPTFQEVIDLSKRLSRELRREIGIYPETKHPTYFKSVGLPLEPKLVRALNRNGLNHRHAKVFVQSFEVSNLKELKRELRVPLVQLVWTSGQPYDFVVKGDPRTYADLIKPAGLHEIATYASGLGPEKTMIVPRDASGYLQKPTALLRDAHRAGLKVHAYTFRNENSFLPADFRSSANPAEYGNAFAEYELYYKLGVDGLFSDNPDTAVAASNEIFANRHRSTRSSKP